MQLKIHKGLPGTGIEPAQYYYWRILSPLRLPFRHPGIANIATQEPVLAAISVSKDYFVTKVWISSNTWGKATAILDKTLRLSSTLFVLIAWTKVLYLLPRVWHAADSLSIQRDLIVLFLSFLSIYACCQAFTKASLTCLYTLPLPRV